MRLQSTLAFLALSASFLTGTAFADTKSDLAAKMVVVQRGPEMDRVAAQITRSVMEPAAYDLSVKIDGLPDVDREKLGKQLNAEMQKTGEAIEKIYKAQMDKSAQATLQPAYMERFTEDELKQLVTMFEAPVFKKYQTVSPELGQVWMKATAEGARPAVVTQVEKFKVAADKILAGNNTKPVNKTPAKADNKPVTK